VKTNIFGALNALELAKRTGARILQASTSEVYGDPLEHPQKESYNGNVNPIGPRACYDEGKRCAETLFFDYHREHGVDIRVVRIFNTYGPRMAINDGRAISNFIVKALRGEDIIIYGGGTQTRSPQYISDLIEGMVKMMEQDNFAGPVNLGNSEEITIAQLAKKIIDLCGSNSEINLLSALKNDPQRRNPDIKLAQEKLSWRPQVPLEQGLKLAIADFEKRLKRKVNILVFSTAYEPFLGPAEKELQKLMAEMPEFHFHILTSRFKRTLSKFEQKDNLTIRRLGWGAWIDKYWLALFGGFLALRLHRRNKFSMAWSVMASYGALAAIVFKTFKKSVPFMVFLYHGDLTGRAYKKAKLIWPLYRLIFKKSEAIKTPDDVMTKRLKDLSHEWKADLLSVESTLEVSKIKETYSKLVNRVDKKLSQPK